LGAALISRYITVKQKKMGNLTNELTHALVQLEKLKSFSKKKDLFCLIITISNDLFYHEILRFETIYYKL